MTMEKEQKKEKMVLKYHYNQLALSDKLELRDEFVKLSGVSMITFYQKMRNDTFKPLERELLEKLFIDKQLNN